MIVAKNPRVEGMIESLESQLQMMRELVLESDLTKLEKLKVLTETQLGRIEPWVVRIPGIEDVFTHHGDFNKYEIVKYYDWIQYVYEDEESDVEIVVKKNDYDYVNRKYIPATTMKKNEVIEIILDYALKNCEIGFKFDW